MLDRSFFSMSSSLLFSLVLVGFIASASSSTFISGTLLIKLSHSPFFFGFFFSFYIMNITGYEIFFPFLVIADGILDFHGSTGRSLLQAKKGWIFFFQTLIFKIESFSSFSLVGANNDLFSLKFIYVFLHLGKCPFDLFCFPCLFSCLDAKWSILESHGSFLFSFSGIKIIQLKSYYWGQESFNFLHTFILKIGSFLCGDSNNYLFLLKFINMWLISSYFSTFRKCPFDLFYCPCLFICFGAKWSIFLRPLDMTHIR